MSPSRDHGAILQPAATAASQCVSTHYTESLLYRHADGRRTESYTTGTRSTYSRSTEQIWLRGWFVSCHLVQTEDDDDDDNDYTTRR